MPFKIGSKDVGGDNPCYIISEVGVNHEGNVALCKEMILASKEAGADSVKLQTIDPDENYVVGTISHNIFSKAWLTPEETADVFEYAKKIGIDIFTTAGDFKTLDWVEKLGPCAYKVSSGLLSSEPIVEYILKKDKPVLISTGMSDLIEISKNLKIVESSGRKDIGIFHCTSLYPTPKNKAYLGRIKVLEESYPYVVGFSDHTLGIECSVNSIFSGAKILERHFSFDNKREGFDHSISLEKKDFKKLVKEVREAEIKYLAPDMEDELSCNKRLYERCLIAGTDIKAGDIFSPNSVKIKRPLPDKRGADPSYYHKIIGKICSKDLKKDEPITKEALKKYE